ncbi:MAG: N-6 DNA methylase [Anaerolineales bacterium]|nr:N-6 DNA methylase [Anaerolineales bacterium]
MPAPDRIKQLIETFEQNIAAYHSQKNETELRRQFLDPFFEALGWDVDNKKGYDERSKEVAHEYSVEIDGAQKKADYAFRVGRDAFDFLVEAKKPSVRIESALDAAFQIRRYGWSAGLPVNILTDFEHFAVYDCRTRPNYSKDKVGTGLLQIFHYKDYIKRWDEIAGLFSPDAIRKGALDSYRDQLKGKKGTQEVDEAFLEEIEAWRETLAKNIALRNKPKNLTEEQINFAVQMTIDRIIFLRIAEERGMEKDRRLFEQTESANVYRNLRKLFEQADARYNSGLFHFKKEKDRENPDTLTPTLEVDDKVLKDIIKDLYYPSPYAFNYIPADILGSVYERFLGKVIRLTADRNAKVDEKPEVRKAGGVYYTPTYIVDYIVKNTVGKLLASEKERFTAKGAKDAKDLKNLGGLSELRGSNGLTPDEASKIKIVDPACGSGSFLLGAYQFLLDWHLDWYIAHDLEKSLKKRILLTADNKTYRLSLDEKKRILLNNIHGVDIDPQAVEVTKLSLLLKVVEDPGQLTMFEEGHILPNLNKNIKNGNALIGTDYFSGQMFGDMEEMKRVKPFEWKDEFPEVFRRGGFDVVIGNPPWGANLEQTDEKYFHSTYSVGKASTIDTYSLFIERSVKQLKSDGFLGYIVPDTFLRKDILFSTRKFLLEETAVAELIETGPVFSQVRDTWCLIFVTQRRSPSNNIITHRKISRFITSTEERLEIFGKSQWTSQTQVKQSVWANNPKMIVGYSATEGEQRLVSKIEELPTLKELDSLFKISRGEEGSKFALTPVEAGNFFMVIPQDIERYKVDSGIKIESKNLTTNKVSNLYMHPKIWIIRIQKMRWKQRVVCAFDERVNSAGMKTLQVIVSSSDNKSDLKYLSALLSSRLINFWCVNYLADDMNQSYLERLPIRTLDLDNPTEKSQHDTMVSLVEQMLALHKQVGRDSISSNEKELLERQIKSTDRQIDELVYQLYGLTEEEIQIVEG